MLSKTLLTTLLCITITVVKGQDKMQAPQIAAYQTQIMTEELNLDHNQIESLKPINLKYAEKMTLIMHSENNIFSKMKKMKQNNNSKNEELKKILSSEQMQQYEKEVQPKIRKHLRQHRESQN